MLGIRLSNRFYFFAILLFCLVVIGLLGHTGHSPSQVLFWPIFEESGGTVEAGRRPPEPPTWTRLRQWEDNLPQHDLSLPFPEGSTGRYVKFDNQIKMLGWNNVLNEVLMNAHLSYVSGRSYVFLDYYWKPEYYSWPKSQFRSNPPRTPLNALISGPAAGGPWDEGDEAPRAISERWYDIVCPYGERRFMNTREFKPPVWNSPGIDMLNHWSQVLRNAPERCIEIQGDDEHDMFPQVFDLWMWGSTRVLSLWEEFSKSPVSRDPYDRMMAIHIRRGDFKEAWNLLPQLPDSFEVPPSLVWDSSEYNQYYVERCFPEQQSIVAKVREARKSYISAAGKDEKRTLDVMYLLTNAKGNWLAKMIADLKQDGWHTIVTSKDLELNAEQTDVNMAVDMDIARKAAVFIGNGWSSFTSNIVHRRLVDGKEPLSTRFW
ncbi:Myosin- partial [Lentinula edodes]|uniref:Myosin-partial n=1 Tax=Lentinula edodes TaxID=5353 RepID=A0A1Q3EP69_LENED|nr:Myosin- partial [Lentinula edodes]